MNTEQKAKAYDEALEKAKAAFDMAADKDLVGGVVRTIFPELRESEDERIRKAIIDALYSHTNSINILSSKGYSMDDVIAYLEKQKETANSFTDGVIEVRSFQRGIAEGRRLERQKECVADSSKTSANEDESIRKFLVDYFTSYKIGNVATKLNGVRIDDILNYLEKQKEPEDVSASTMIPSCWEVEQKPAEWDDYTKTNLGRAIQIIKDARGTLHGYQTDDGIYECDKAIEALEHFLYRGLEIEKLAEWSEDIIRKAIKEVGLTQHQIDWFKTNVFPPKPEWSEEDEKRFKRVLEIVDRHGTVPVFDGKVEKRFNAEYIWLKNLRERLKSFRPQSKQKQNDYITPHKEFFKFIYDRLINVHKENPNVDYMRSFKERLNNLSFGEKQEWSEEDENKIESIKGLITMGKFVDTNTIKTIWKLLDSLRPQPKVEWSEEDEKMRNKIVGHLSGFMYPNSLYEEDAIECIDWLKSLRPQPHWEPSEEQMEALKCAVMDIAKFSKRGGRQVELENEPYYSALHSLYEQLLKLGVKEEPEYYQHFDPDC